MFYFGLQVGPLVTTVTSRVARSWRGLLAYGIGLGAMVPFFDASWYVGPVASLLGYDIAALVGLPVTCVVYYVLARTIDLEAEAAVVARDPQRLAAMRVGGGAPAGPGLGDAAD
jgi:NCS1 family nucleobase:cation symporter-1